MSALFIPGPGGIISAPAGADLAAMVAGAVSGTTIRVGPGTYNARNLLKNGVNWYFEPGAIVDYSGDADGSVFSDGADGAAGAVTCKIMGFGVFIYSGVPSAAVNNHAVFNITNASSNIEVEGASISNTSGSDNNNAAVFINNGTAKVRMTGNMTSSDYDAIVTGGGTLEVTARAIEGGGDAVEIAGGAVRIVADSILTTGVEGGLTLLDGTADVTARTINAQAGNSAIFCDGGTAVVRNAECTTRVFCGSGTLTLNNVKVDTSADNSVDTVTKDGGTFRARFSTFVANAAKDFIIAGSAQTASLQGCFTNKAAVGANITNDITGGVIFDAQVS